MISALQAPLLAAALAHLAQAWPFDSTHQQQQQPISAQDHSQGYEFDPLLHLPGISPYFDAVGFGLNHEPPPHCKITAASYLVRHASIYANDDEYEEYIKPLLFEIEKHRGGFSGSLEFLNKWTSPILEDRLEDITPAGKHDARKVGEHLVQRYPHLVPTTKRILADKKPRTYDTAVALAGAFPNNGEDIDIVRVLRDVNGSMDAIVPHKSCPAFSKEPGKAEMATFISHYAPAVSERLEPHTPFKLSDKNILGLQSLCGYQSAIEGARSPICSVFTDAEWMAYEYAWDLRYAYMVGPLNPLSPYLGFPWLAAQIPLLDDHEDSPARAGWPKDQRFFLSFTHREVPPFVAAALGIFNSSSSAGEEFPTDRINWARAWRMSDLTPFLGHVGMEKIRCESKRGPEDFVRFVANQAPRPLPDCQSGPGASCSFEQFRSIIDDGAASHADYHKVCGESPK